MLRKIYHVMPLSLNVRKWLNSKLPIKWKRQSNLRDFGVINELYFWRLDRDIDTIAPIHNFFSAIFPELDTATEGCVWIYDRDGKEIYKQEFLLPQSGMHVVRISEFVSKDVEYGTFMWVIKMPDSIANKQEIIENHIYFTDRGYVCYEKHGVQPSFSHGVDRYLVFQKQEKKTGTYFYKSQANKRSWLPEMPLDINMQDELDIVLLNRSGNKQSFTITIFQNGGKKIYQTISQVSAGGVGLLTLNASIFAMLNGQEGYFLIEGLATKWGRPAIMRHFESGAFSVMHC